MQKEVRTAVYDEDLCLEAYYFEGVMQPFPNHFHDYYVIGIMEKGRRILSCKGHEYAVGSGSVLVFNPGDSHACAQDGSDALTYRCLNISQNVMLNLVREIIGSATLSGFTQNVITDQDVACHLRGVHQQIMQGTSGFGKEESLLLLIAALLQHYYALPEENPPACRSEIQRACSFIEQHYSQSISLQQICDFANLSKSALLRAFTRAKGVTPYSYLENVRIGEAKKLLEHGVAPIQAALQTGFCDQSHFTNCFKRFIGLTPGAYRGIFSPRNEETS